MSRSAGRNAGGYPPRSRQAAEGRGVQARGQRPHALRICTRNRAQQSRGGQGARERRRETPDSYKNQVVQPPGPLRKDATMTTTRPGTAFILLFRGVGGATQLPTAPLREVLTEAGFENVATYINSGNAVLRSHLSREKVIAAAADICRARFGFTKAILAPTLEEWSALIDNNPFPQVVATPTFLHAAVLAVEPAARAIRRLRLAER